MSDATDTEKPMLPFPPLVDGATNWTGARVYYYENKAATYEEVAEILGVARITVARRAGGDQEAWQSGRAHFQSEIVREALMNAMASKARGALALIECQYQDALDILGKLRAVREAEGARWGTADWLRHIQSIEAVYNMARQALGLPKDFVAEAGGSYEDLLAEIEKEAAESGDEIPDHENL